MNKKVKKILNVKNISIIRDNNYIIKNISFSINEYENWAIIGKNGCGKSFLLKSISTMIYPSKGEVEIYGNNIVGTNLWDLRKKIAIVSDELQKQYDEYATVKNIILSGFFSSIGVWQKVNKIQNRRANEILEQLNIQNLSHRIYKTLSSGEQKKTLIGRALVFRPKLIILDEPCNGLDVASKIDFLNTLRKLVSNGINLIFVTHNVEEIIPEINNVILMKKGKIHKIGDKKDILTENNLKHTLGIDLKLNYDNGFYWIQLYK
ncbi:MAG: ATP-binding cassette domain-containing protein [Elusimicrobiota bacterium]|jgi:iron complex transport system ATP-binding protein|nr:ATP-binding cassette domain-containing protein [Elusimicrobiota bacterium]